MSSPLLKHINSLPMAALVSLTLEELVFRAVAFNEMFRMRTFAAGLYPIVNKILFAADSMPMWLLYEKGGTPAQMSCQITAIRPGSLKYFRYA